MVGVPKYDWDEVLEDVLDWIREGKTLTSYCKQEGKPSRSKTWKAIKATPERMEAYEEAKEEGVDVLVESTLSMIRSTPQVDRFGRIDAGQIQWMKLRLEHCMRLAGVWSSRYSPKKQVEHTGGVTFQVITGVPDPKAELEFQEAKLLDIKIGDPVKEEVEADGGSDTDS